MRKRPCFASKVIFKIIRFFGKVFYKKTKVVGREKLEESGKVIVANHAQLNGPIISELFLPENCYTWANGQMVRAREVPSYAMEDFFSYKNKLLYPVYKLFSLILSVLLPCVINNARVIPVYRDARIVSTFRMSVRKLAEGKNIVIFPECHERDNNIVNVFQENFVDIGKLYHRKTGEELEFVPMYIAPDMASVFVGDGIRYNSAADPAVERKRITKYLSEKITRMGRELPEHTVVPFDNISRKRYLSNKDIDAVPDKK